MSRSLLLGVIPAALLVASGLAAAAAGPGPDETSPQRVHRKIVVRSSPGGEPIVVQGITARRAFLGVHLLDLTPELRRHFGAGEDEGVLVSKLEEGSPAAAAGVRVGDLLLSLGGETIDSGSALIHRLASRRAGETVGLVVLRGGERRSLSVTLEERERPLVDIRELVWHGPEERHTLRVLPEIRLDELEGLVEIDQETLEKAIVEMRQHLGPGGPGGHQLLMIPEREMLMERIDELERRLRELEDELAALARK